MNYQKTICFVCNDNKILSVMAQKLLQKQIGAGLSIKVESKGLLADGDEVDCMAKQVLAKHDILVGKRKSRQIGQGRSLINKLVITMDESQKQAFMQPNQVKCLGELVGGEDVVLPQCPAICDVENAFNVLSDYINKLAIILKGENGYDSACK